jgi:hypothetical protein
MLTNPILHRVFTSPFLYQWVLAMVSPLLLWAVLVRVARRHPGILPRIYPLLKILAWVLWAFAAVCGLYGLLAMPGRNIYYGIGFALFSGINLIYHWVRRRVDPASYIKKDYGWWPTPKDSPDVYPGKNL